MPRGRKPKTANIEAVRQPAEKASMPQAPQVQPPLEAKAADANDAGNTKN